MIVAAKANAICSFPAVVRLSGALALLPVFWLSDTKRETQWTCLPKIMVANVNVNRAPFIAHVDKDGAVVLMRTQ